MTAQSKDKPLFLKQLIAPILTVICLAMMALLTWLLPFAHIIRFPFNLAGLLLIGIGLAISFAAERQFHRVGTNLYPFKDPNRLVTDGMFRFCRNPMYLGLTIFLAGTWILSGSLSPFGIVILFFVIADRWYIPYEEQRLARVFGQAYETYRTKTPRWI